MKTLDEHNKERAQMFEAFNNRNCQRNDIECPSCGCEMFDTDSTVLTSSPPQRKIHCACGFRGQRVA